MKATKINITKLALLLIGGVLVLFSLNPPVSAQTSPPNRFLQISDSTANQPNVNYTVGFDVTGAGYNLGSVYVQFCANSPLIGLPCTPITAFDASAATVTSQSGITGFSVAPGATAGGFVLTRTASFVGPTSIRVEVGGIHNPLTPGTSYGRLRVFATEDASGPSTVEGGVTFSINGGVDLQTEVPPYLTLCVALELPGYLCSGASGNFIDFGEFRTNVTKRATSKFVVATNADNGFVVYAVGNPPTSGVNVIPGMNPRAPSQAGTSQFGLNLRNNSNPNIGADPVGAGSGVIQPDYNVPNQFKFVSGEPLVSSNTVTLDRKFTVSYIVNIDGTENPGVYSTTLLYVALATF